MFRSITNRFFTSQKIYPDTPLQNTSLNDDNEFKHEFTRVLCAVQKDGLALQFASNQFKQNKIIVSAAIENDPDAFEYASDVLKNDFDVIVIALKRHPSMLKWASKERRNNYEFMAKMITEYGASIAHASSSLKDNRALALLALQKSPWDIYCLSDGLKDDLDIARLAIKGINWAFEYVSDRLKNDEAFVQEIMSPNDPDYKNVSLEFASADLKDTYAIVEAAVEKEGDNIKHASNKLQVIPALLLKATRTNPFALDYAPLELQDNESFILKAVEQNLYALAYASERVLHLPKIKLIAVTKTVLTLIKNEHYFFCDKIFFHYKIEILNKLLTYHAINKVTHLLKTYISHDRLRPQLLEFYLTADEKRLLSDTIKQIKSERLSFFKIIKDSQKTNRLNNNALITILDFLHGNDDESLNALDKASTEFFIDKIHSRNKEDFKIKGFFAPEKTENEEPSTRLFLTPSPN